MRGIVSLVSLVLTLAIALVAYKVYFGQMNSGQTAANPVRTIDETGVKNDLLAIAQAERMYQTEHGSYASLDELNSSGVLNMRVSSRDGYRYDVEQSGDSFRVIARCPAQPGCTSYNVDSTLEIRPGE